MRLGDLVVLIHKQDLCPVLWLCGVRGREGRLWEREKRWLLVFLCSFAVLCRKDNQSTKFGETGDLSKKNRENRICCRSRTESSQANIAVGVWWVMAENEAKRLTKRQIAMFSVWGSEKRVKGPRTSQAGRGTQKVRSAARAGLHGKLEDESVVCTKRCC